MSTVTKKGPDDKPDHNFKLVAVNGSKIPTYGVREIMIQINRKKYSMPAVVCDVQQDILGMDFLTKYKLNFEWDDFDQSELYLVDKKAQIKALLQIVTVPTSTLRVNSLDRVSNHTPGPDVGEEPLEVAKANEAIAFEVACMKQLDPTVTKKKSVEDQLKMHSEEYIKMIKNHPKLSCWSRALIRVSPPMGSITRSKPQALRAKQKGDLL